MMLKSLYMATAIVLITDAGYPALAVSMQEADAKKPAAPSSQVDATVSRSDLEKQFRESLTGAVLQGTWQMTGQAGLAGKAPLGDPRPEKYSISDAVLHRHHPA